MGRKWLGGDPSDPLDLTTKAYVDAAVAGGGGGGPTLVLPEQTSVTSPPDGSITFGAKDRGVMPPQPGFWLPSGEFRPTYAGSVQQFWQAQAGTATLTGNNGLIFSSTGTATAISPANTNRYTRMSRVECLVTTANASAVAGLRVSNLTVFTGSGTDDGGFELVMRGGPATGAATASSRFFMGASANTGAPSDVEPSTAATGVGLGWDSADATVMILFRGTTTEKISTGWAVPTTDRSVVYGLEVYKPPGATQTTAVFVTDLISGNTFTHLQTTATNQPLTNVGLAPRIWSSAGGTSSVIGIALHSCLLISNF